MKTPLAIYALCLTSAFAQTTNTKEPGELVRLRQDYNQKRANALKPIDATYRQQLELLMRNLTSRNQLDAAILVRKELDELSTTDAEKAPLRKALLESKWSWNSPEVVMTFKEDGTVSHIGMHGTWKITGRNEVKLVESGSRVRTFRFDEALQTYKQVEKSDPIHGSRLP